MMAVQYVDQTNTEKMSVQREELPGTEGQVGVGVVGLMQGLILGAILCVP